MAEPLPIKRDWVECLASCACILIFVVFGVAIVWSELFMHEATPVDSNILVYVLGFTTREVGALSIGRGGNGQDGSPSTKEKP